MAEGPKLLEEALESRVAVDAVYLEGSAPDTVRRLARRAGEAGARLFEVQDGVLARVSDAVTPQPVTAVLPMIHVALPDLPLGGQIVVCAGVQDPGNAGTVLRSAAAAGAGGVVFTEGAVDVYNPKTVRASAGSLFRIPVAAGAEPVGALDHLGRHGVLRVGTEARGGTDYEEMDWTGPHAVVLGSESHGLPSEVAGRLDRIVSIPMQRGTESLNVGVAAAVLCFEAARQRRAAAQTESAQRTSARAEAAPAEAAPTEAGLAGRRRRA